MNDRIFDDVPKHSVEHPVGVHLRLIREVEFNSCLRVRLRDLFRLFSDTRHEVDRLLCATVRVERELYLPRLLRSGDDIVDSTVQLLDVRTRLGVATLCCLPLQFAEMPECDVEVVPEVVPEHSKQHLVALGESAPGPPEFQ